MQGLTEATRPDILLHLRQITLPLVKLQLFLEIDLLGNLLTTREYNLSVKILLENA